MSTGPESSTPPPSAAEAATTSAEATGEGSVGSIDFNPEALVEALAPAVAAALDASNRAARQRAQREQEAETQRQQARLEAMMGGLHEIAERDPSYYRNTTLNRHEQPRRDRERAAIEAENEERRARGEAELPLPAYPDGPKATDYDWTDKNRFGKAALTGIPFAPGVGDVMHLNPVTHKEVVLARRASRVANRNAALGLKIKLAERHDKDLGHNRHGVVEIDPETGKSDLRDPSDPKMKLKSKDERKIIKQGEHTYKLDVRKHRNQVHYLEHQGENFFSRHNVAQRVSDRFERVVPLLARLAPASPWYRGRRAGTLLGPAPHHEVDVDHVLLGDGGFDAPLAEPAPLAPPTAEPIALAEPVAPAVRRFGVRRATEPIVEPGATSVPGAEDEPGVPREFAGLKRGGAAAEAPVPEVEADEEASDAPVVKAVEEGAREWTADEFAAHLWQLVENEVQERFDSDEEVARRAKGESVGDAYKRIRRAVREEEAFAGISKEEQADLRARFRVLDQKAAEERQRARDARKTARPDPRRAREEARRKKAEERSALSGHDQILES